MRLRSFLDEAEGDRARPDVGADDGADDAGQPDHRISRSVTTSAARAAARARARYTAWDRLTYDCLTWLRALEQTVPHGLQRLAHSAHLLVDVDDAVVDAQHRLDVEKRPHQVRGPADAAALVELVEGGGQEEKVFSARSGRCRPRTPLRVMPRSSRSSSRSTSSAMPPVATSESTTLDPVDLLCGHLGAGDGAAELAAQMDGVDPLVLLAQSSCTPPERPRRRAARCGGAPGDA